MVLPCCCPETRQCRTTASADRELTFGVAALPLLSTALCALPTSFTALRRTTTRKPRSMRVLPGVQHSPWVWRRRDSPNDRRPHQHRRQPCSAALRHEPLRQPLAEAVGVGKRQGCRQRVCLVVMDAAMQQFSNSGTRNHRGGLQAHLSRHLFSKVCMPLRQHALLRPFISTKCRCLSWTANPAVRALCSRVSTAGWVLTWAAGSASRRRTKLLCCMGCPRSSYAEYRCSSTLEPCTGGDGVSPLVVHHALNL